MEGVIQISRCKKKRRNKNTKHPELERGAGAVVSGMTTRVSMNGAGNQGGGNAWSEGNLS